MSFASLGITVAIVAVVSAAGGAVGEAPRSARYDDLVLFFRDWRAFQKPKVVNGVPDYTAAAMAAQRAELPSWQRRLAAIDPSAWPIPRQVDYQVVRAELNGLDFDHRVLKPWANNPAFYVTVYADESDQPAREGPLAAGGIDLWAYEAPLTAARAAELEAGLRSIPGLLVQAKRNLTGNGHDLWVLGTKSLRQQSVDLAAFASRLAGAPESLRAAVAGSQKSTDELVAWLESQAASKTEPSGIGVENYDWYLKHVQLVALTWRDEVTLMERELARAHALLAMEELRNAPLPPQQPVATAEEFDRKFGTGVSEYMAFLKDHEILEVRDWMDGALRERVGKFHGGKREFFSEVDYRDPEVMRTHGYHWFDKGRMQHQPHASPIRRGALLYNIFNTRTEGHATGWEELMMQAGMFDERPRSRELVYILLAERAARALGDLHMQSNELTLEQASALASAGTPRGWLTMDGDLVRAEQHLYLQQPGYGTSYLVGKIEIENLIAERRDQLGARFSMKQFMEELDAAGLVPATLVRWELTGRQCEKTRRMLGH